MLEDFKEKIIELVNSVEDTLLLEYILLYIEALNNKKGLAE